MNMRFIDNVDLLCAVANYVPAAWLPPALIQLCFQRNDRISLTLRAAVDLCRTCGAIVLESGLYTKRVDPCGCLVHAPCALDNVIDAFHRDVSPYRRFLAWRTCPRCGLERCTNLDPWMHDMSIVDCRFFMLHPDLVN